MIRAFGKTLYYGVFLTIVSVGVLLLASLFPFDNWYQVKVVLSGSMEPSIQVGSIVVIRPQATYTVGDVITFGADNRQNIPVTHRIIDQTGARFSTKGDANSNIDPKLVMPQEIIGAVKFTIPYVGYVIEFSKTSMGFWTLIIFPAVLIVLLELSSIFRQLYPSRSKSDHTLTIS